jgi:hypothetical protein
MLDKVEFLQVKLADGLRSPLHRVGRQVATLDAAGDATIRGNVVAQLHHLDAV